MVANTALRERLRDELLNNQISHAYIIEGAPGTGRHMLAMRIAAAIACEKRNDPLAPLPCMDCPSCRKILGGNSPDVISITRGSQATLGVEAVRGVRQDVFIAPNDISAKIYLIEDAHLMTVQAQNALLLTLEEPPSYVLFLLLCDSASGLLETVRSRAPVLRTEPVPVAEMEKVLCRIRDDAATLRRQSPAEFSELLVAANGSIGRGLALLDPKLRRPILEQRKNARTFVSLFPARQNSAEAIRFFHSIGQKREELTDQFNVILLCLRDLLLCKQTERAPLCFFSDREEAVNLCYRFSVPELLNLCDRVGDAIDRLRANANVRLTLSELAVGTGLLPV